MKPLSFKHLLPAFLLAAILPLTAADTPQFTAPQPTTQTELPQTAIDADTASHPAYQVIFNPIADPLEGFNRPMESFNGAVFHYVVHPVSLFYNTVVPEGLQTSITNFGHNLCWPLRLVCNCLQGKGANAWEDTKRFGINTTVGCLGFFDKATEMGYRRHDEDFGQTLAVWGVGPGCYLNLPLFGPSNVRDTLTKIPDMIFTPASYVTGANFVLKSNSLFANAPFLDNYFHSRQVTYPVTRAVTTLARDAQIIDGQFPPVTTMPDESLGIMKLKSVDRLFYSYASERQITLPGSSVPLSYSLFRQKHPDGRLLFVLPGLSSTRGNADIVAMAELFHRQGWTVAVVSSTFTPEYISGTNTPLPGLLNLDAQKLDATLALIRDQAFDNLTATADQPAPTPHVTVFGVSLGAINALYLAALDHQDRSLLKAERFIAVNPPRRPLAALQILDDCFDIPLSWPAETRLQQTRTAIQRIALAVAGDDPSAETSLALSLDESRFIIGLNCRLGVLELMRAIADNPQNQHLIASTVRLDSPEHLEQDAFALSYCNYIRNILFPYAKQLGLAAPDADFKDFTNVFNLDNLSSHFTANPKIRLFHNQNDFLNTAEDIAWFQTTFANRCVIFPQGSHLGNLFLPQVQDALVQAAR